MFIENAPKIVPGSVIGCLIEINRSNKPHPITWFVDGVPVPISDRESRMPTSIPYNKLINTDSYLIVSLACYQQATIILDDWVSSTQNYELYSNTGNTVEIRCDEEELLPSSSSSLTTMIDQVDDIDLSSQENDDDMIHDVISLHDDDDSENDQVETSETNVVQGFFASIDNKLTLNEKEKFIEFALSVNEARLINHLPLSGIESMGLACIKAIGSNHLSPNYLEYITRFTGSLYLQKEFLKSQADIYVAPELKKIDSTESFYYISIRSLLQKSMSDELVTIILNEKEEDATKYVREENLYRKLRISMDKNRDINIILRPLIEDIIRLKEVGIKFSYRGQEITIPVELAYVIGDNLAINELLGLKQSFASGFICRYCSAKKDKSSGQFDSTNELNIYKAINYDGELLRLDEIHNYKSPFGIAKRSGFSLIPKDIFKIAPPDTMHDILEGILPDICNLLVRSLARNCDDFWSTFNSIKWINGRCQFEKDLQSVQGKAYQLYTNFCINITPKAHFISHYGELIKYYGNLQRYATGRMERKNAWNKQLLLTSKNRINSISSMIHLSEEYRTMVKLMEQRIHIESQLLPMNDGSMQVHWPRNGQPLIDSERLRTINEFGFVILDITTCYAEDSGLYETLAKNDQGEDFIPTTISVKAKGKIITSSSLPYEIIESLNYIDIVTNITNRIVTEEKYQFEALRFDRSLQDVTNVICRVIVDSSKTIISDTQLSVEYTENIQIFEHRFSRSYAKPNCGTYTCVARSTRSEDMVTANVEISTKPKLGFILQLPKEMSAAIDEIAEIEAIPRQEIPVEPKNTNQPQSIVQPLESLVVLEGDVARFSCRIIGFVKPRVMWVLNDNTIVHGSRYKIKCDNIYHLEIPKTHQYDNGKVECYAHNAFGETYTSAMFDVHPRNADYSYYDDKMAKYQEERKELEMINVFEERFTSEKGDEIVYYTEKSLEGDRFKIREHLTGHVPVKADAHPTKN
ncbi:hypothetical protein RDWZM_009854 [Blomia tropicalis]|uniref:Ig-like domain-containing protein n=1 Tax=Blomia tropicalis TaxID=40697 RepID=A0A9Q0LXM2_BLOTA|nr:hypothetical protein RDWZM_009854 [Blomia tropicalis]